MALTPQQQLEALAKAHAKVFSVEHSYPWTDDKTDIRHDGYRIRIAIANLRNRIRDSIAANEEQS